MILARYAAITGIWPKDQAIELNELLMSYENTGNLDTGKIEQVISLLKP
jgi:ABC-type lipoprotein export system ATPase subunit